MGEVASSVGATGDSWDENKNTSVDGTGRRLQKAEYHGGVAGKIFISEVKRVKERWLVER